MAGYDEWSEQDPWEFDEPEEPPMNATEPTSRKLLRQIQHAAGLDPDGPRLVPMQARLSREATRQAIRCAGEIADRDARLRRALRFL